MGSEIWGNEDMGVWGVKKGLGWDLGHEGRSRLRRDVFWFWWVGRDGMGGSK